MLEPIKKAISEFIEQNNLSVELIFGLLILIAAYQVIQERRNQAGMEDVPKTYKKAMSMKVVTLVLLIIGFLVILIF